MLFSKCQPFCFCLYIDGLVQERRNSIANTVELPLSCTNPLIYWYVVLQQPLADLDPFRAVLHVDPVVLVVPDGLYSQVVGAVQWMSDACEGLDEEALGNITFSFQH